MPTLSEWQKSRYKNTHQRHTNQLNLKERRTFGWVVDPQGVKPSITPCHVTAPSEKKKPTIEQKKKQKKTNIIPWPMGKVFWFRSDGWQQKFLFIMSVRIRSSVGQKEDRIKEYFCIIYKCSLDWRVVDILFCPRK